MSPESARRRGVSLAVVWLCRRLSACSPLPARRPAPPPRRRPSQQALDQIARARAGALGGRLGRDRRARHGRDRLRAQSRPGRDDRVGHEDALVGGGAPLPRARTTSSARRSGGAATSTTESCMGSLLVVGGGDPNISGRFYDNDSFAVFDRWADGLRQAGIVRVSGDLILNASAFDGMYRNPEWPPDRDTRWYQAPISALSYNDNVVIVSVGRGALPGAPAIVSIDPGHRRRADASRARARSERPGKVRVAVARPGGSDTGLRRRHGAGALLPLLGAARDRRSAEVLRRGAEEPAARRGHRARRAASSSGDVKPDNAWVARRDDRVGPDADDVGLEQAQPELLRRADLQDARAREDGAGHVGRRARAREAVPRRDRPRSGALRPPRRLGAVRVQPRRGGGPRPVPAGHERAAPRRRLALHAGRLGGLRGVAAQPPARLR